VDGENVGKSKRDLDESKSRLLPNQLHELSHNFLVTRSNFKIKEESAYMPEQD
jgi:hypothetical protein